MAIRCPGITSVGACNLRWDDICPLDISLSKHNINLKWIFFYQNNIYERGEEFDQATAIGEHLFWFLCTSYVLKQILLTNFKALFVLKWELFCYMHA